MIPVQIFTHERDGLARLITQYKGKPNITGILSVYLKRIQALENMMYRFFSLLDLDAATGKTLDLCGGIVGERRRHADDNTYRLLIKTRIQILSSFTTIELAVTVFKVLMGTTNVKYTPLYPASIALNAVDPVKLLSDEEIRAIMLQVIPSGVGLEITESTSPAFVFEDGDGEGFGDVFDSATGGGLAGVIE